MSLRIFIISVLLITPLFFASAQGVSKKSTPTWIKNTEASYVVNSKNNPSGSSYYLLIDRQVNLPSQERFNRNVFKILSSAGVQEMSDLSIDFDPEFETLSFHTIKIYRDGAFIDKLASAKIKTVQREQSMDRYLYDGTKTAYVNLTDVRVGDVIEYAYSVKGHNPVFGNHFCRFFYFDFSFPYQKLSQRILLPKDKAFFFHYKNGEVNPTLQEDSPHKEYTWVLENVNAVISDNNTPGWYEANRYLAVTDFSTWNEVNAWALKQFTVSQHQVDVVKKNLPPDLLKGTLEEKLLKAIRFVQDEIRYLGFENGVNSHQPHAPLKVLSQRFGDCKDKSLLLAVIARINGIDAYPVLVNTSMREKLNEDPPTYFGFDHCVVQFAYNNKSIFIDPTIDNQGGSIDSIYFPNYGKGLIVKEGTSELITIHEPTLYGTTEEQFFKLDSIGGGAKMTVRTTYVGKDADAQRSELSSSDLETTQKNYLTYYGNLYPDITLDKSLLIMDNRNADSLVVEEYYLIKNLWKPTEGSANKIYCEFYPQAIDRLITIEKSTQRNSPYRLTYPLVYKHITTVKLPESWNAENERKNISTDYYEYDYSVVKRDLEIIITNEYKTKATHVPADLINTFVADHQRMGSELTYMLSFDKSIVTESASGSYYFLILILSLISGVLLILKLNKFDPPSRAILTSGQPIGGWLILVCIGLCLSPIILIYTLANPANNFFNESLWANLWNTRQFGLLTLVVFELYYNIVLVFFTGLLILVFFQRRTSLPILIRYYYGITLFVIVIDSIGASFLTDVKFSQNLGDILRNVIVAAIWIPYFINSERVKETFTERL